MLKTRVAPEASKASVVGDEADGDDAVGVSSSDEEGADASVGTAVGAKVVGLGVIVG